MKKILILLSFLIFSATLAKAIDYPYVGNQNTHTFHYQSCRYAKTITNKQFFLTIFEALNSSYLPCKTCKPISDKSAFYQCVNDTFMVNNTTPMDFCHEMIYDPDVLSGIYYENNITMKWKNE